MKIIDYDMSGCGVAKEDGKVYFVKNALMGEDVSVKILSEHKNFCRAVSQNIDCKSPFRVQPPCKYYGKCGGCQLQHFEYAHQLNFKRQLVQNTLKKVGGIVFPVQEVCASKEGYRYRNKSVFVAKSDVRGTSFGMYEENSRRFIKIEKCLLAKENINDVLAKTQEFFADKPEPNLKHLMVRTSGDQTLVTLVADGKLSHQAEYLEFAKHSFKNFGLYLNQNSSDEEILSGSFKHLYGLKNLTASDGQSVYPGSFMQVNDFVKTKLYKKVVSLFDKTQDVVDAYCGGGYLSYLISQKARSVVGIESYPDAVKSANELKNSKAASNLKFVLGDVKNNLSSVTKRLKNVAVVLDPPRKGCDKAVIDEVCSSQASKVVYIACSPVSLAKDLKGLVAGGFVLDLVQPYDMFSNTANVETLVVLHRQTKDF